MRSRLVAVCSIFISVLTLSLRAQPLADKLPADTLIYFGWQGASAPGAGYAGSHLEAIMNGSNLPQFFGEFLPHAAQLLASKDRDFAQALPLITAVAGPLWQYPSAVYFGGVDVGGAQPMPKAALLINAGADADRVRQGIAAVVAKVGQGPVPVLVDVKNGLVVVTLGNALPATLEASIGGTKTLKDDPAFKAAMEPLVKDPVVAFYVNLQEIWATVDRFAPQAAQGDAPSWAKIRDSLNLTGMKSVSAAEGFDGKDWVGGAFLAAPAPRAGFLKALETAPLGDDFLKLAPKTSISMSAGRFRPAALLDAARAIWSMMGKGAPPIENLLQQVSGVVGFDVEKDFLDAFGDEWVCYTDANVGGTGLVGTALVHRAANAAKLEQSMGSLEAFINNAIAQNLKEPGMKVEIKTNEVGGLKLHYLAVPFVTPTWTMKDGNLYFGLYPQTVVGAVAASSGKNGTILENEAFVSVRKRLGETKASGIHFIDLTRTVPETYGPWVAISRMVGVGDVFGIESPLMMLPPMNVVMENVGPAGSVAWSDDAGFHMRDISPFPGSALLGTDPIRAYLTAVPVPVMVGVLLPAMSKGRESALRAKDASNLKQIGTGCQLYANEYKGKFPPDLGTLLKTEDLTAQVFVSPLSDMKLSPQGTTPDQLAAWVNENASYEYRGAGKTTTTAGPDLVIACTKAEIARSHGGMNVLYGDGHVEWVSIFDAERILQQQPK